MWAMYDSVDPGTIPASANAVAGYREGFWPDYLAEVKRWPHAQHLSIAVSASGRARCLDVEKGDATPAECPGWFSRNAPEWARLGLKVVFYASASVVADVERELAAAGIHRSHYLIWSAHYTFYPHICGHACGLSTPADATQWTNRALGRNLDESLVTDPFFRAVAPPALDLTVLTEEERDHVSSWLAYRKHPVLHHHGLRVEHAALVALRKAVWAAWKRDVDAGKAPADAWAFRHRAQRWHILKGLTG